MVAVMIVSVVIASLLTLQGNSSHILMKLQQNQESDHFSTFLLYNKDYGMQKHKEEISLYRLVEDFDMDDDLRRELKSKKVTIEYKELQKIDLDTTTIEVGETTLSLPHSSITLMRVKML
jgi:hypothetical protein